MEQTMKRLSVLLSLFLILAMIPLMGQDKVPAISFDSLTKDFGKVTEGAVLKVVFKFANRGSAPLDVLKVEPS